MTPTELDVFIRVQKIDRKDLAEAIKVTPSQLSATLSGSRKNQAIRLKIACFFHKPIEELFGADFDQASRAEKVA